MHRTSLSDGDKPTRFYATISMKAANSAGFYTELEAVTLKCRQGLTLRKTKRFAASDARKVSSTRLTKTSIIISAKRVDLDSVE